MKKQAFNPFLPLDTYIPDGEPHVFGDRVYLYGSHDAEDGDNFCLLDYECWSAPVDNLNDWRCEGTIYRAEQCPHYGKERQDMYAPDVVQGNDGRYYLYYDLSGRGNHGFDGPISVAVCDTPAGKYTYLVITGIQTGWGPFAGLFKGYGAEVDAIVQKYPVEEHQSEIIFYGASNFRLWTEMENDLAAYRVQNHGFGGSTDEMLVEFADKILYPYNPAIVVFQTGSNDYISLSGTDEEKAEACMAFKCQMFDLFHEKLPDAQFVVMSGLLLPGRIQYASLTNRINEKLQTYCEEHKEYMTFVCADALVLQNGTYQEALFLSDGIHLNRVGQQRWCQDFIQPQLDVLIEKNDLHTLCR